MSSFAIHRRARGKIHHYILSALVLIAAFIAGVVITKRPREIPPVVPTSNPSTTTAPTSKPIAIISSYMDVVRATYPSFPATQPLEFPAGFDEAARIVIDD